MVNYPKYTLNKSINNQFYWNLFSVNKEVLLTSETMYNKQDVLDGIASSKRNLSDSNFERKASLFSQPYFVQVAVGNYKVLGKSEMYSSVQARENGIAAVKRDAPYAGIEDLT